MPDALSAAGRGEAVVQKWRRLNRFLDAHILRQHREPIAFYTDAANRGVGPLFWPYPLGALLAVFSVLLAISLFADTPATRLWLLVGPWLCACFLLCCLAVAILAAPVGTQSPKFWMAFWGIYLFSPPILLVIALCGLVGWSPPTGGLGWIVGLPLGMGIFLADIGAVSVHARAIRTRQRRIRLRSGGQVDNSPELQLRQTARRIRFLLAAALILGGAGLFVLGAGLEQRLGTALCFVAVGVLRMEAILLGALGWPLLTTIDPNSDHWRVAYVGRNATYLPAYIVAHTLRSIPNNVNRAAAVLALMQEGDLGTSLGRALGHLSTDTSQRLLVHLSLEGGSAQALCFLAGYLPPLLRPVANSYATLAAEAAQPPDMQRWLNALPPPVAAVGTNPDPAIADVLASARGALLLVQDDPTLDQAIDRLRRFIQELIDARPVDWLPAGCWPLALLAHLKMHRRRLHPAPTGKENRGR